MTQANHMIGRHFPVFVTATPENADTKAEPREKGSILHRRSVTHREASGEHVLYTSTSGGRTKYLEINGEIECASEEGEGVEKHGDEDK